MCTYLSSAMGPQASVTLIVGLLAAAAAITTWQQKTRADRRSEWWRRTMWSFERTFSGDEVQADLGWAMLSTLMRSKLATKDDSDIVQVIAELATMTDRAQKGG